MSGVEQYAAKVRAALTAVAPALYEALGPNAYNKVRQKLAQELAHHDGVQTVHATLPSALSVKGASLHRTVSEAHSHRTPPGGVAEQMASSPLQHSYGHRPTGDAAVPLKRGRPCVGLSPRGECKLNRMGCVNLPRQCSMATRCCVQSAPMRLRRAASTRCAANAATSCGKRPHGRRQRLPRACGTGRTGCLAHLAGACMTGAPAHWSCPG